MWEEDKVEKVINLINFKIMSKKSGFFYLMATMISSLFMYHRSPDQPQFQSEGDVHKSSGGKEITSYGTKPAYMKDKVLYRDLGDIIWTPTGSYWRTRALAEANR